MIVGGVRLVVFRLVLSVFSVVFKICWFGVVVLVMIVMGLLVVWFVFSRVVWMVCICFIFM